MTLLVFDFDWSLIDCNSDTWVVEELGASDLMRLLRKELPWTSLMDRMMTEIMSKGRSIADVEQCLKRIPLDSAMVRSIKFAAASGCDLQIISDANTFYIQTVLKNFNVDSYFSQVHSNPAHVDDNGVLRIHPYQSSDHPHGCTLCPSNMCKGLILSKILNKASQERVIYIGDGDGDLCPSLHLTQSDHLLARRDFPLAKNLAKDEHKLNARLHLWTSAKEIETSLANILTSETNIRV